MKLISALRIIVLLILTAIGSIAIGRMYEPIENCDLLAQTYDRIGTRLEWRGYPTGWDLPAGDFTRDVRHFTDDGGLWTFRFEADPDAFYVICLRSYKETADANGEHYGAHNFIGPWRVEDQNG